MSNPTVHIRKGDQPSSTTEDGGKNRYTNKKDKTPRYLRAQLQLPDIVGNKCHYCMYATIMASSGKHASIGKPCCQCHSGSKFARKPKNKTPKYNPSAG